MDNRTINLGGMVDKYEIIKVLSAGGFGNTYLATDTLIERKVVLREYMPWDFSTRDSQSNNVIATDNEEFDKGYRTFLNGAEASRKFYHSNLVKTLDVFQANNTVYMASEYITGQSLEELLANRTLNEDEVESIVTQIIDGIQTVHQAGFVHRDIKPRNILITKEERPSFLKKSRIHIAITDFTKMHNYENGFSPPLMTIYSPGYSSIEQTQYETLGPKADIYALAATAYQCLTGTKTPSAEDRVRRDKIQKLGKKSDSKFLQSIDKALAINEKDRFKSTNEWAKAWADLDVTILRSSKKKKSQTTQCSEENLLKVAYLLCQQRLLHFSWFENPTLQELNYAMSQFSSAHNCSAYFDVIFAKLEVEKHTSQIPEIWLYWLLSGDLTSFKTVITDLKDREKANDHH